MRAATNRVLYSWPLAWPWGHPHLRISDYVDEDPTNGLLRDFMGGNFCYDGHFGTDMNVNSFEDMDAGVPILAVANGRVAFVQDWDYDRELDAPYSAPGNGVVLLHEDGSQTTYWHMRTNSATVQAGEYVREGQILGLVGSAGTSTNPHLHFQMFDPTAPGISDPWGGTANPLPSRWKAQPEYAGAIPLQIKSLSVTTNSEFFNEGGLTSWQGFKNGPSQPVVFGIDEPNLKVWSLVSGITRTAFTVDVRRPDGTVFTHLDGIMPVRDYGQSFQYWDVPFAGSVSPADYGTWTVEAFRDGASIFTDTFLVGETSRFAPRFTIGGRSFHLSSTRQEDVLSTSYLSAPAESLTFTLENAPSNVSLRTDELGQTIVVIDPAGPDLAAVRSREFAVVARDPDGNEGRMHYHLVNYDASILGSPPVVTAPAGASGTEGDSIVVEISATDPDGDPISAMSADWSSLPAGNGARFDVSADRSTGRFVWPTGPGDQGTYPIQFIAQTSIGAIPMYGYPPIVQTGLATTTVTVRPGLQARAFTSGGDRTLRLLSGKPSWCVHVQSVDGSFDPSEIDPGTVRLRSVGTGSVDQIAAILSDLGSRDGRQDSLPEATFCFGKKDLVDLFSRIVGSQILRVTIVGNLMRGTSFTGTLEADVIGDRVSSGGSISGVMAPVLAVTPNPSRGGVSFSLRMPPGQGGALDVYDLTGRRVRHIGLGVGDAAPRIIRWDGRDQDGGMVGSGVYWVRMTVGSRKWERRLVLLK